MDTKAAFRAQLKARREALPERDAASAALCRHLDAFCRGRAFTHIGAFWPLGTEVDLRPAFAAHPDWLWCFPRVASARPPRLLWGPEPLEPGPWGLREPVLAPHPLPPVQLLLVPGLAFDDQGYRLGYGGGYYDALLAELDSTILTLGVGFEAQMHLPLPVEPHDRAVQGLLSEQGLRLF